ncbi:MAG TPA: uroporphyrinogen-III synthase [Dokdonella sp.]
MPDRPVRAVPRGDALRGATIVVTRPAGTSAALVARIRAGGAVALALPGLALRGVADVDADTARAQLGAARGAAVWIFTSPAAVRYAYRLAPSLAIAAKARVLGVGAGTVRALGRHGVAAAAPPARSDSEGLLAMAELARVRGRRVALVGAPGGRDLIAPALRRRGAEVDEIHVYARAAPRLTRRHFRALERARDPLVVLLSSGEALANLAAALPPPLFARLRDRPLVVASERLAAFARGHGFVDVAVAGSAAPAALLAAAAARLARPRA